MASFNVQFVPRSANVKVGPIPVTNSTMDSCPPSCPFLNNGCYASAGFHTRLNWEKVTAGTRGTDWKGLCDKVSGLADGSTWRHNVSGDLPHQNEVIDAEMVSDLVEANRGKRGFTYTHHRTDIPANLQTIRKANDEGFTVNLSANDVAHADELLELNAGPVVCVVAEDQLKGFRSPAGNRVVICPAVTKDSVTCSSCKLCAVPERSVIVAFPAHGTGKKKIAANQ